MADTATQPKSNGADYSTDALKATLAGTLPGAIKSQNAEITSAKKSMDSAQAIVDQGVNQYEDTEGALQAQYNDALSHANDVAQRQRGITLDITKGIWKFAPIAIAFGLLASKETGGNVAAGVSTMMQGLAGYANGRVDQYNAAYKQWQDSLKAAQDDVKEISRRAKDIMGDQKIDLNTRIKMLQLETTNYQHLNQAALTNDPAKIVKTIADLDRAQAQFEKAAKKASGKASPNISGDLSKTAMDAIASRYPAPPITGADGKPIPEDQMTANVSQIAQANSPGYYTWAQKQKTLARQLAQAAQSYVADGMTNSEAITAVMGDWTKKGLLPRSMPSNFNPGAPAASPSGAVQIGGQSYPLADVQAWAKKHNMTVPQYTDWANSHLAKGG